MGGALVIRRHRLPANDAEGAVAGSADCPGWNEGGVDFVETVGTLWWWQCCWGRLDMDDEWRFRWG